MILIRNVTRRDKLFSSRSRRQENTDSQVSVGICRKVAALPWTHLMLLRVQPTELELRN